MTPKNITMNKEFVWTDELVKEMIWSKLPVPEHYYGNVQKCIDEFKSFKMKDWEILALSLNGKIIKDHLSLYHFSEGNKMYSNFITHSVLRLSDKAVFSVGEEVDSTWGKQIIIGFEIQTDDDMVVCFETCRNPLEKISKLPERTKLFTTEDGVDIYAGDHYWYVNFSFKIHELVGDNSRKWDANLSLSEKIFGTEEKAKEYVTLNKPCLSVNDVCSLYSLVPSKESLINLAKSKL